MRAWFSPLFLLAVLISLLLHFAAAFGDSLWLWWQSDALQAAPVLKPTTQKLQSQALDAEAASLSLLDGVKPAEQFLVRLGRPATKKAPLPAAIATAKPVEKAIGHEVAAASAPVPPANTEPSPATASTPVDPTPPVEVAKAQPTNQAEESKPTEAAVSKSPRPLLEGPFPRSVDITYLVKGVINAEHHWRVKGKQYEIDTQGSLLGKSYEMKSEGEIGPHGLKPKRYLEYRDKQPQPKYQVDFDWDAKVVHFGEPGKTSDALLEEGAQDLFSAAYQFALQGNKLPNFNMQVVSGRKSYQLSFEIKGEAELILSGEKISALVLAASHDKYRFEFYLAPQWHNLPVRMRRYDGDSSMDLVATQLTLDGKNVLKRIERTSRDR